MAGVEEEEVELVLVSPTLLLVLVLVRVLALMLTRTLAVDSLPVRFWLQRGQHGQCCWTVPFLSRVVLCLYHQHWIRILLHRYVEHQHPMALP
jgi:hypothetical protein